MRVSVVVVLGLLLVASVVGNVYQWRKYASLRAVFEPEYLWLGLPDGTRTDYTSVYYEPDGVKKSMTGMVSIGGSAEGASLRLDKTKYEAVSGGSG
jgi:hypothetical protein